MKPRYSIVLGLAQAVVLSAALLVFDPLGLFRTQTMRALYPTYRSVGEIRKASGVVILGSVQHIQPSYRVYGAPAIDQAAPANVAPDPGYLRTDILIHVDRVVAGDQRLKDTTIPVIHPGGSDGKDRLVMEGEPLSQVGEAYLLFLKPAEQGKYVIVGGPQGRYVINNGTVEALTAEAKTTPVGQMLNGMSVQTVASDFERLSTQPALPAARERQEPLRINPAVPVSKPSQP